MLDVLEVHGKLTAPVKAIVLQNLLTNERGLFHLLPPPPPHPFTALPFPLLSPPPPLRSTLLMLISLSVPQFSNTITSTSQTFIAAHCAHPTIPKKAIAFARLANTANLGSMCHLVRFVVIIVGPIREVSPFYTCYFCFLSFVSFVFVLLFSSSVLIFRIIIMLERHKNSVRDFQRVCQFAKQPRSQARFRQCSIKSSSLFLCSFISSSKDLRQRSEIFD